MQQGGQHAGGEGDQQTALATIDVDEGQLQHRVLHIHLKWLACAKGRGAAHKIATVLLGVFGRAGLDGFYAQMPGQRLCGYLHVTMHQNDEWGFGIGFHEEGFDDSVFRNPEGLGGVGGATTLGVRVAMNVE